MFTTEKEKIMNDVAALGVDKLHKVGYVTDCILYCSLFHANYEFTKETLLWSWTAAGLITRHGKIEKTAMLFFDALVRFQYIVKCGYKYKLADDKSVQLDKLQSLQQQFKKGFDSNANTTNEIEHLSLIFEEIDQTYVNNILTKCSSLKTLLLHKCRGLTEHRNLLDYMLLNLKTLTSLDLSSTKLMHLPSSVQNLKSLKYLDLSNNPIRFLPSSLDSLDMLETLILSDCINISRLPKYTCKLVKLEHLVLDIARQLESMPIGIGNLTNLQTLGVFLVDTDDGTRISELKNMNRLKGSLRILGLDYVRDEDEALNASLWTKKELKEIELSWNVQKDAKSDVQERILQRLQPHIGLEELKILYYSGGALPSWIDNPCFTNISRIYLSNCKYCETLPSFGKLPSLKVLSIIGMDGLVHIDSIFCMKQDGNAAFPVLENLSFYRMTNLEDWTGIKDGDFPCLKRLHVTHCPKLVSLPSLSYLISLEQLQISSCPELSCLPEGGFPVSLQCLIMNHCPKLSERCCNEQGEDWNKVVVVPDLYIENNWIQST